MLTYYIHLSKKQMELSLTEIQEKARCNWCLNSLRDQVKPITEANFIDTGKTFRKGDTTPATAVYCNECLASEYRRNQPKSAIDRKTLNVINMEDLISDAAQPQQPQPQTKQQATPRSATKPQEIS